MQSRGSRGEHASSCLYHISKGGTHFYRNSLADLLLAGSELLLAGSELLLAGSELLFAGSELLLLGSELFLEFFVKKR